jgi:hypothetical protein
MACLLMNINGDGLARNISADLMFLSVRTYSSKKTGAHSRTPELPSTRTPEGFRIA